LASARDIFLEKSDICFAWFGARRLRGMLATAPDVDVAAFEARMCAELYLHWSRSGFNRRVT
jgi:hypothetical protein